jgi:hypothetical protein
MADLLFGDLVDGTGRTYFGDLNSAPASPPIGGGDTTPPATPIGLIVGSITPTAAVASCLANVDDTVEYAWRVNGALWLPYTAAPSRMLALTPGGSWAVTVAARDAAGNESAQSAAFPFTTPASTSSARFLSGANLAELLKLGVRLRLMAELDFPSGIVRVHDGVGDIEWMGNTYGSIGGFGSVEELVEDTRATPKQLQVRLAAVPNEALGSAMTENYQGRDFRLLMGFLNHDGQWIAAPEEIWYGHMDVMKVRMGRNESEIRLICEDPDYAIHDVRRMTLEDHQRDFAGDKFFELLRYIPGFKGNWAQKGYGYGSVYGTGGYLVGGGNGGRTEPGVINEN